MSPSYPRNSVQEYIDPWWERTDGAQPSRGRLLWALLPHTGQQAFVLVAEGREEPTRHDTATFSVEPLHASTPPRGSRLPVAGLPHFEGEVRLVLRAKRRPAVVLSTGGVAVARELRTGAARYQANQTLLVAPYYGVGAGATRGGWRPDFVTRIRRAEYPQYCWDMLPIGGASESILRLDHLQPLGNHGDNFELTDYKLTDDALFLLDEWLAWLLKGTSRPRDGVLADIRNELLGGTPELHGSY